MKRPFTLIGAVALNVLIGVTTLLAGVLLVAAVVDGMLNRIAIDPRNVLAARMFVFGLPIYGVLAIVGAFSTWRRSARGWWLALAVDLVGIAFLAWQVSIDGPDWVSTGLVIWGVAVVLLVLARTRAALRS
jgi:hypothetical protein